MRKGVDRFNSVFWRVCCAVTVSSSKGVAVSLSQCLSEWGPALQRLYTYIPELRERSEAKRDNTTESARTYRHGCHSMNQTLTSPSSTSIKTHLADPLSVTSTALWPLRFLRWALRSHRDKMTFSRFSNPHYPTAFRRTPLCFPLKPRIPRRKGAYQTTILR